MQVCAMQTGGLRSAESGGTAACPALLAGSRTLPTARWNSMSPVKYSSSARNSKPPPSSAKNIA